VDLCSGAKHRDWNPSCEKDGQIDDVDRKDFSMNTDFRAVRQNLNARLKDATSHNGLSESIRIAQAADPLDVTQEAAERDIAVQILDRESLFVRQLRSAIDRLDDGSYGTCLRCETEIAAARLNAIPWAELCIRCQETAEGSAGDERLKAA
jgi:DnaK suppressor protein